MIRDFTFKIGLAIAITALSANVHAADEKHLETIREPIVLHDTGQTKPLSPFLARVKTKIEYPAGVSKKIPDHGFRLPIITDSMSVGKVEPKPLAKINENMPRNAMRPMFLFGADRQSLEWVIANREYFKELRAVGMLIQASTSSEVTRAKQAVGDIPLFGGSANDIAEALKLSHYPILITPAGVSQ